MVGLLVSLYVTWEDTVGGGSRLGGGRKEGRKEGRRYQLGRSGGCEIEKN